MPDRQTPAVTPTPLTIASDLLRLAARVTRMAVGGLSRREIVIIAATASEIAADIMELASQAKED